MFRNETYTVRYDPKNAIVEVGPPKPKPKPKPKPTLKPGPQLPREPASP